MNTQLSGLNSLKKIPYYNICLSLTLWHTVLPKKLHPCSWYGHCQRWAP